MELIVVYVVLMVVGDLVDFGIGYAVSQYWSEPLSLPIFLACYFLTLWLAWLIAVRITDPKTRRGFGAR